MWSSPQVDSPYVLQFEFSLQWSGTQRSSTGYDLVCQILVFFATGVSIPVGLCSIDPRSQSSRSCHRAFSLPVFHPTLISFPAGGQMPPAVVSRSCFVRPLARSLLVFPSVCAASFSPVYRGRFSHAQFIVATGPGLQCHSVAAGESTPLRFCRQFGPSVHRCLSICFSIHFLFVAGDSRFVLVLFLSHQIKGLSFS
jgi:hypothetical protein